MYFSGDNDAEHKGEWSSKNNNEDEEIMRKLQNDQELRRKQEEEMAQIYPVKFSWTNGGNENEFKRSHGGGLGSANIDGTKVFETYGDNLASPLIRAHVDTSSQLQIEREMQNVSKATPRLRQKWQKEENRSSSLSPVLSRKQPNDERKHSTEHDDKIALEEQLRKLQLEAQLAR